MLLRTVTCMVMCCGRCGVTLCVYVCVCVCVNSDSIVIHHFLHPLNGVRLTGTWHLSGCSPRSPLLSCTGVTSSLAIHRLLRQPTDLLTRAYMGSSGLTVAGVALWAFEQLPRLGALGIDVSLEYHLGVALCIRRGVMPLTQPE